MPPPSYPVKANVLPRPWVRVGRVLAASVILTPAARAQPAGSLHYTLDPVAVDAAGRAASSVGNRYTLSPSAMAGGAGHSASYTSLSGYAGQLQEPADPVPAPAGIALRASPATLAENGTRQLQADLYHTDGSWTPLAPALVTWTVQSGPVSSISPGGLAVGRTVFRDTTAILRGQYQTFTATLPLLVLDTLPDNFGSYAGDGLPDHWQATHFGLDNPDAAPQADPDADGFDNRFEYDASLAPFDRFSTFHMFLNRDESGAHHIAFYPFFAACRYDLMGSSDLDSWFPVTGQVFDQGNLRTIVDPDILTSRRFYRMDVRRE
jgi:hypothetical protein